MVEPYSVGFMRTQHYDGWGRWGVGAGSRVLFNSIILYFQVTRGFIFAAENKLLNSHVSNFLLEVTLGRYS